MYNNKDVVSTLEAMQKRIEVYHQKEIFLLKLCCILSNMPNNCLYKSTDSHLYPFTESHQDLLEKIREDMVSGRSIVFTRKAVVDETVIRKPAKLCKSIVGIDASQLYLYSMCQPMPTGLFTRWNYDTEPQKFMTGQTKHDLSKKWSFLISNKLVRNVELKTMLQLVDQRRLIAFVLMEFVTTVTLSLKQWVVISPIVHVKKIAHHWPTTNFFEGRKRAKNTKCAKKEYIKQKGYKIIEMWECN